MEPMMPYCSGQHHTRSAHPGPKVRYQHQHVPITLHPLAMPWLHIHTVDVLFLFTGLRFTWGDFACLFIAIAMSDHHCCHVRPPLSTGTGHRTQVQGLLGCNGTGRHTHHPALHVAVRPTAPHLPESAPSQTGGKSGPQPLPVPVVPMLD